MISDHRRAFDVSYDMWEGQFAVRRWAGSTSGQRGVTSLKAHSSHTLISSGFLFLVLTSVEMISHYCYKARPMVQWAIQWLPHKDGHVCCDWGWLVQLWVQDMRFLHLITDIQFASCTWLLQICKCILLSSVDVGWYTLNYRIVDWLKRRGIFKWNGNSFNPSSSTCPWPWMALVLQPSLYGCWIERYTLDQQYSLLSCARFHFLSLGINQGYPPSHIQISHQTYRSLKVGLEIVTSKQ